MREIDIEPSESMRYWHKYPHVDNMEFLRHFYFERNTQIAFEYFERALDPFMGCGTTGEIACNLQRRFIGIERNIDKYGDRLHYFDTSVARIKAIINANTVGSQQ